MAVFSPRNSAGSTGDIEIPSHRAIQNARIDRDLLTEIEHELRELLADYREKHKRSWQRLYAA